MATFARVYEEASPLRSNGTEYDQYRLHVPAWLPRWQAWILIEAVPETFFVTPHYRGHPDGAGAVRDTRSRLGPRQPRARLAEAGAQAFDAEQRPADQKPRVKERRVDRGIQAYIDQQSPTDRAICDTLMKAIDRHLPEAVSIIWHAHPVWFLDGNPIVGFSKLKGGIRLLFWSGQSFEDDELVPEGKFKAAEIRYTSKSQIDKAALQRWLEKSKTIQWDYKNIVKR